MHHLARLLGRWPIALAAVLALAAIVVLPGLGESGLLEPHERQLADRAAPRRIGTLAELDAIVKPYAQLALSQQAAQSASPARQLGPTPAPQAAKPETCPKVPPHDAAARSLTTRAIGWGRDALGDSDAGRRLPLALLGLLCVLASAGVAMRLAGARAGVATALVLVSMPLLVLQSRSLTSEIGTATGGALIVYGLVALGQLRLSRLGALDAAVAVAALAFGLALGFYGGGALLGVAVPVGAYAAAGGLGGLAIAAGVSALRKRPRAEIALAEHVATAAATVLAIAAVAIVIYQLYDLVVPLPGAVPQQRALFGKAIVPSECWSSALGALWRRDDDLRFAFDSLFEQIAYGTFPWGVVAPIACFALVSAPDRSRRRLGAIALAWAAGAWLAGEAFQRRAGFTIYAGFPALAIAVGAWLDMQLARPIATRKQMLVGLFVLLAVLDLAKDMQALEAPGNGATKLTSLLVGADSIAYPTVAHVLGVPAKLWILLLGLLVANGFAVAFGLPVSIAVGPGFAGAWRFRRGAANVALAFMFGGTVALAAFWAFAWQPTLATHLSSKVLFDTYDDLAQPGETLAIMGDLGDAPHDYAPDIKPEVLASREQVVAALSRPQRVFAIAPIAERCTIHRDMAKKPYFVVDDRNTRSLLYSNKVDGTTDKNPLRDKVFHEEPKNIPFRPKGKVVFDGRIQLLGWDIPKEVSRGGRFDVKMFYKVLMPVGAQWTVLFHFDGGLRFNGDHPPIDNICTTATWMPGDYIVDTYSVIAGGGTFAEGPYDVWTGFFTGTAPNWKNMPVSEAPGDMRDGTDRVKITTIVLD